MPYKDQEEAKKRMVCGNLIFQRIPFSAMFFFAIFFPLHSQRYYARRYRDRKMGLQPRALPLGKRTMIKLKRKFRTSPTKSGAEVPVPGLEEDVFSAGMRKSIKSIKIVDACLESFFFGNVTVVSQEFLS